MIAGSSDTSANALEEMGDERSKYGYYLKNIRSQNVLEKVGFQFINVEGDFWFYRIEK